MGGAARLVAGRRTTEFPPTVVALTNVRLLDVLLVMAPRQLELIRAWVRRCARLFGLLRPGFRLAIVGAAAVFACGCAEKAAPPPGFRITTSTQKPVDDLSFLKRIDVGRPMGESAWLAHVNTADLDQDGLLDILACEARDNEVLWIRQVSPGVFEEHVIADDVPAPVHVEVADVNGNGHLDVLVSAMGYVFPNNDLIGQVVVLENDGNQQFTTRVLLDNTYRVTDIRGADLNGNGRMDLAVAQFGYDQGQVCWMEQVAPWEFRVHVLIELSGAINVGIADFTGNGAPDIVALISQQWEEVYLFANDGHGNFTRRRIWGSTNEDYGSSGLSVADINGNGRPDILYTNGDGFGPAAVPGPRPWHGVQWFENLGNGNFRYHRIGHFPGAYSPIAVDLDGDGHMDIVASSAYADWANEGDGVVSLMWYRNDGNQQFKPRVLAYLPRDLITVAAGRFGPGEEPSLVTGGFPVYPPYDNTSRVSLWRRAQR